MLITQKPAAHRFADLRDPFTLKVRDPTDLHVFPFPGRHVRARDLVVLKTKEGLMAPTYGIGGAGIIFVDKIPFNTF